MSDADLRELERRWRRTGSVEDEAAYLRDLARTGGLAIERLELASLCGHPAAMRALERADDDHPFARDESPNPRFAPRPALAAWISMLHDADLRVTMLALRQIAEAVLPAWYAQRPDDRAPEDALDAIDGWLTHPTDDHALAAMRAGDAAELAVRDAYLDLPYDLPSWSAGLCAAYSALALVPRPEVLEPSHRDFIDSGRDAAIWAMDGAADVLGRSEAVIGLLRPELMSWLLARGAH
jgi:hypothetical protein